MALAATMGFAACSSDETESQPGSQANDVINLTSSIAGTRATEELQTNAVSTDTKVGVFGISGTTAVTNGANNPYAVGTDGGLTADSKDMKWPSDESAKVDLYAYAPYQSSWTAYDNANAFSVAADQSTKAGYLASDLLYAATKGVSKTGSAVVLNFGHKLARINVKLTKGDDAAYDVSSSTVSICGTKTGTTLNPSTGALGEATGSATDIKIGTGVNITATGVTTYGVVVPQSLAAGSQFVKIVADGKILSAKLTSAVTLEAGKAYNFTATIGSSTDVALSLGSVTLTGWGDATDIGSSGTEEVEPEPITLTATFGTPGGNADYTAPTYHWTAGNSNLMTIFEFNSGELAKYHTLKLKFSNLTEGAGVRVGYYIGSDWTEINNYYSEGEKTIDLTALGIDLSTVTKISFGGKSGSEASVDILASDVVLIGNPEGVDGGSGDGGSGDGGSGSLTATFGTPGGNASYDATTFTYAWTGSTNNLMTVFEFSSGELANYTKLSFTFGSLVDGPVRMGYYVGSTFTEFGSGYYSAGTKDIDLTALGIDLSTVTKIAFGGRSNAGSCTIKASEVILSKASE